LPELTKLPIWVLAGGVSVKFPSSKATGTKKGRSLLPMATAAFDEQGGVPSSAMGFGVCKAWQKRLRMVTSTLLSRALQSTTVPARLAGAPSVDGQAEAIVMAQSLARLGDGLLRRRSRNDTLGDPIEVAALSQAFRASTDTKGFCALGSVKSNIGHLDAAGMAGLIKTALALKYKLLPVSTLKSQTPSLTSRYALLCQYQTDSLVNRKDTRRAR